MVRGQSAENGQSIVETTKMRSWNQFCHNSPGKRSWQVTQPHQMLFFLNILRLWCLMVGSIHSADVSPGFPLQMYRKCLLFLLEKESSLTLVSSNIFQYPPFTVFLWSHCQRHQVASPTLSATVGLYHSA